MSLDLMIRRSSLAPTLPMDSELPPEMAIDAATTAVIRAGRHWERVLIVEDDPDSQWKLARLLTVRGHRVVGTSSAEAALALLGQWRPDLVLADYGLPRMSGFEMACRIRDQYPKLPIVLLTSHEDPDLSMSTRVAGAVAILRKPITGDVLEQLLVGFDDDAQEPSAV